jgi:nucleoside phosphorylase
MTTAELLFVAADQRELAGLLRRTAEVTVLRWPVEYARAGVLGGLPVILAANGVGRRRAAEALEFAVRHREIAGVVSAGYCGALRDGLAIGDIVVGSQIEHNGSRFSLRAPKAAPHCTMGPIASIDRVAQTADEKRALGERGAAAVEMEAAGIAEAAGRHGLPVYCVRAVTDLAHETFRLNLNAALRGRAHFSMAALLQQACWRPASGFTELARLYSRCRTAAYSLGEFLAACRF